jgi:hypothetical protein
MLTFVYNMISPQPSIYPLDGLFVSASPLEGYEYSTNGAIGFDTSGVIDESSNYTIYPAFDYGNTKIEQPQNDDLTANSTFLPVPDIVSEARTPSQETSIAQDASQMTQNAIERMVNPSSLLSSAIDDIRESGSNPADDSQNDDDYEPESSLNSSFLINGFSTFQLYGMKIPPKDYLIVSSYEASEGVKANFFATVRVPCDNNHETPLRLVLLENWSSITYPPPKMELIHASPEGHLCMFKVEYQEDRNTVSQIVQSPENAGTSSSHIKSTAVALYNSGSSELKLPAASSIAVSRLGSS